MSDGPHRSLPMRPRWKRVAECGDNDAFAPDEVSRALLPALEQDCRDEISPQFINSFRELYQSLFKDHLVEELEALRPTAGCGIGGAVLDYAIQLAANDEEDFDAPTKAMTNALIDRAAKGARQVEEHYCRESTAPRGQGVRSRIEQAISDSAPAIEGLSRKILNLDSEPRAAASKQQGLDDGVKF
jgi:hypothetical protein